MDTEDQEQILDKLNKYHGSLSKSLCSNLLATNSKDHLIQEPDAPQLGSLFLMLESLAKELVQ